MFDSDEVKRLRRTRSRILRGPFTVEAQPGESKGEKTPQGVKSGYIDLNYQKNAKKVSFSYNTDKYGGKSGETFKELTERHENEIAKLKKHLENVQEQAEKEKEKVYRKGKAEGYEEGIEAGRVEVSDQMEQIRALLQTTMDSTRDYFSKVEDRLADFAMMIAKRVVGNAADASREVAVVLAKEVIKQAVDKSQIVLLVNPNDLDSLKEARADLMKISEGIGDIKVERSVNVRPGGVILESKGGSIDATIDTMLDEIHKAMKPGYEKGVAGEEN